MTARIRVLVVDDSAIARRFIVARLEKDTEIEVVGVADCGSAALAHIRRDPPDVVLLDEEMPDMRGRDVLKVIRAEHPAVAVVMFSARVGKGSQARFEALLLGADDAVAKPTSSGGPVTDDHPTWTELLTKAKQAARRPTRGGVDVAVARRAEASPRPGATSTAAAPAAPVVATRDRHQVRRSTRTTSTHRTVERSPGRTRSAPPPPPRRAGSATSTRDVGLCVIASSTGGPDALSTVFAALPADFPLPILIAQHMPPHFTRLLAERIDARSELTVREAQGREPIEAGTAWIAPGDHHLVVDGRTDGCLTALHDGPPENSCRPAADTLFRSAVETYGERIVACVLSGMGHDGAAGATLIHDAGGRVIAQDEETSVVWGMPGAVVAAGAADAVLPLPQLADELTRTARLVAGVARRRNREVAR